MHMARMEYNEERPKESSERRSAFLLARLERNDWLATIVVSALRMSDGYGRAKTLRW